VFQVQALPPGQTIAAHGSPHAEAPGDDSDGIAGWWQPPSANAIERTMKMRLMRNE
jgi:hypothetical protein